MSSGGDRPSYGVTLMILPIRPIHHGGGLGP
jgi:hypothetical protein